jgi:hypothetical protein
VWDQHLAGVRQEGALMLDLTLTFASAVLVALLVVIADLALGRPDGAQPGATMRERLALRARPARIAITVLVLVVLLAGGAFELAKGVRWLAMAIITSVLAAAVQELATALSHHEVRSPQAFEEAHA